VRLGGRSELNREKEAAMANNRRNGRQATLLMRYTARGLALIWAGFWVFFGVASGLGEELDALGVFMHTLVPGLIFLVFALVAWKWELLGGLLVLLSGVAVAIGYPVWAAGRFELMTIVFVLLTMALPPLVAGILHLASWATSRRRTAKASEGNV